MFTRTIFDQFVQDYIKAALWSTIGDDESPLDDNYGAEDIAPDTLKQMRIDCARFIGQCYSKGLREIADKPMTAAHDFWLTRERHGCGFWDGGWTKGDELTKIAHGFGGFCLYVGDDGLIYGS